MVGGTRFNAEQGESVIFRHIFTER